MAAARNLNGPPLETAMGSVYIYIYYLISLRAAFVPLAPRYNIYGPIYTKYIYTKYIYTPIDLRLIKTGWRGARPRRHASGFISESFGV